MADDENLIIARAREGDPSALNTLVAKHWPYIYRLALSKTGSPQEAEELAQDTFLRALAALPRYKETNATFRTYLSRITINLITDFYRKRGRTPPAIEITEYAGPIIDTNDGPEEALVRGERQSEVLKLLALLPEEQRKVIELRIIKGEPVADTARLMGKSQAAVKMLQQRALKRLKDLFTESGLTGGEEGAG